MEKNISEIKGFENCKDYIIYDDGNIFSLKTNKFLKFSKDSKGYYYADLRRTNVTIKCPKVHRLVMFAFKGFPKGNKCQVNHIDGNKHNNNINNLEYVTNEENRIHALKLGLKNEIGYYIEAYDLQNNYIGTYKTAQEAIDKLNIKNGKSGNIGRVIRGSRKQSYGYIWKQKKFND